MPQVVIASIAYASAAGPAIATITLGQALTAAFLVGGQVVVRRQQRKALRAAQAQIEDRRFTARGSAEPKQLVFGRTRVGGVQLAPGWTWGPNKEFWTVPVAFAGHEIDAFEDVWLGEATAGPFEELDATAMRSTTGSKYATYRPSAGTTTITGGAVSATYTVPGGATALRVDSIAQADDSDPSDFTFVAATLQAGVDYSVARVGNDLRVTWLTDQTGESLVVTITYQTGTSYLYLKRFRGIAAGERDTELETNSGGEWLSTDVGKGIARLHATFTWSQDIFPSGAPNLSVIARGVRVYDPRLDSTNGGSGAHRFATPSTWAWSRNPALIWAWYMTSSLGYGATFSEIDWPSVITAANVCDETVPINGVGGTQARYTCDGSVLTSEDRKSIVDKILSSMVGTRFESGGKWYVRAGAYVTPALDLDEDDFGPGGIEIQPRAKRRDLFNAIRGIYIDAHTAGEQGGNDAGGFWAPTNFSPYESSTYKTEDGGELLYEDIELPFTTDWRRAQRIAKLMLFRHRQALTISATFKLRAIPLQPGDTFRLTSPTNGWSLKVFRVVERAWTPHGEVSIVAQEESSAVYAWDFNEAATPDPAPNTALPDPRVVAPLVNFAVSSGATYKLPDGSVVPYAEASWSAITDSAVLSGGRIELYWKRASDTVYRKVEVRPSETSVRIELVSGGDTINVYATVVNGSQVRSAPAFATQALDPALPSGIVLPPLSANLLRNPGFNEDASQLVAYHLGTSPGAYSVKKEIGTAAIGGMPSNAVLYVSSALTGNAPFVGVKFPKVPVAPGRRYVGYAGLIAEQTDARVLIAWYTGNRDDDSDYAAESWASTAIAGSHASPKDKAKLSNYERSYVFETAPAYARYARLIWIANGNWTSAATKGVWCAEPFFGEVGVGVTDLPTWDAGGQTHVGTGLLASGAATNYYEQPTNIAGYAIDLSTLAFIDVPLGSLVASEAGFVEVTVTCQVDGSAVGGASALTLGVTQSGKKPLVSRKVLDLASGASGSWSGSISTSYSVSAGETIAPTLRLSRTRFGLGVGNTTDRVSMIDARFVLIKR